MEVSTMMRIKNGLLAVLALLAIAGGGGTYYFHTKYAQARANPQQQAQGEAVALLAKVGQHIELPAGEQPTIATVSEPEKLQAQAFFAHAKKGDKVIIYPQAKKAILYDPIADKILEVAPINIGANANANTDVTGGGANKKNDTTNE